MLVAFLFMVMRGTRQFEEQSIHENQGLRTNRYAYRRFGTRRIHPRMCFLITVFRGVYITWLNTCTAASCPVRYLAFSVVTPFVMLVVVTVLLCLFAVGTFCDCRSGHIESRGCVLA